MQSDCNPDGWKSTFIAEKTYLCLDSLKPNYYLNKLLVICTQIANDMSVQSSIAFPLLDVPFSSRKHPVYIFVGADLLKLTREDLVQICGPADGIRLYNALKSR